MVERLRTLPERHGGRWVLVALCAIVALGVGLRVYAAAERADDPNDPVQDDSIRYYFIAQSLYRDHSFDSPLVQRDDAYHPGSPLFHAGVWYLTGGVNPKASRIAAALLSALMIVFTYLLARRLVGPETRAGPIAGLGAALLIAVDPSSIDFYRSLMNEPLSSITIVGSVLAFLWAADGRSAWAWALPGALIGLTVMFRPEAIVFGIALALVALVRIWRFGGREAGLGAAGALLLAMALVLVPWTARNAVTLHRVTPIAEGGGNALFIGTYLPGDGDHWKTYDHREQLLDQYDVPAAERAHLPDPPLLGDVLALVARQAHPDLAQDKALAELGRDQLKDDISDHPADYAGVLAQKLWNMWGQGAAAKPRQEGPGALGDWYHRIVALLGLIGLVLLAVRRRWEAWVLGSVLVLATLIAVVLLAPPRRNVDLLPLVSALAAYAVATGWPGFQEVRGNMTESTTRSR
jgi:dolichyl-phosphate-mannose-protein mannosyltransferase